MEALPESLLLEQRASFMEDLSRQHLRAYLPQPLCPMWQFLWLQVLWNNTCFVKEIQKGSMYMHVTNPTQCDSYFVHLDWPRLCRPCPLFSGARIGWAHFIAEHNLSSQDQDRAGAKENAIYPPKLFLFRKKEWESEREREREREREAFIDGRE